MRIKVVSSARELARRGADLVCAAVREKPDAVIGLASGRTPLGLYQELVRRVEAGKADLSRVTVFAIDELLGVPAEHVATNASYFRRELAGRVRLRALRVLDSEAIDPDAECMLFERLLERAGGLDLVLLGIGRNGHLAFNEPGSRLDSRTRQVKLTRISRAAFAPLFGGLDDVPQHGLTLGMSDVLASRTAVLLASGGDKAEVVARALQGRPSVRVPASALQRHANAMALLDREAAAGLSLPRRPARRRPAPSGRSRPRRR